MQCGFCTPGLVVAAADLLARDARSVGGRDPRGALREPLPLHRLPEDRGGGAAGGGAGDERTRTTTGEQIVARAPPARARPRRREHPARRRRPEGQGRVPLLERPRGAGHALGAHAPQPARARAHHEHRPLRGARDAGRARRAHARRRPGPEDVRPRVSRPARARDRPRPLLRRAGGDRRRRRPGAGAARRRAHPRRLRAARAGERSGARDRAGAAPSRSTDDGARLPRRSAPERRPLDRHPPRRPRDGGRRHRVAASTRSARRTRRSSAPSPASRSRTAREASTSTSRPSGLHVDRDQVAPCLALEPEQVRIHLAGVGGAFGGREDLSIQVHAALLALHTGRPVKMVYNREESFTGHVHRHPARIWAEHRATREGRLLVRACARAARRRRVRVELGGRARERVLLRRRSRIASTTSSSRARASTRTTRRAARCAASAPCRAASRTRRRWTSSPPRSTSSPVELRLLNAIAPGDTLPTGQRITGSLPVAEVIRRCAALDPPEPEELPRDPIRLPGGTGNTTRGEGVRRGVGFAVGIKNICFSEGFDDYDVRPRPALRPAGRRARRRGAMRRRRGRPGRDRRDRARSRARSSARTT